MNKHTQGPWRTGEHFRTMDIKAGHNALVARVEIESAGDKGFANAALIAAAPDLLAACEWALDLLNQYAPEIGPQSHIPGTQATKDQLRAAIRKAEGGVE